MNGPIPTSANLFTFQKGSGVGRNDATGCEVPCLDPGVAADQAQLLFVSLDDETVWTAQAAIVSNCDECIYGPVELTLRDFVANLKSVCCIDDSCLAGIINAILCNPVLNYRARFVAAQQAIADVQAQNQSAAAAFNASLAAAQATNANICDIVRAVKEAIAKIPQDGGQGSQTRCCLAACLNNLCQQTAGNPPPPPQLPLPCPCPPISCEALANACVVIKVSCAPCQVAGNPVTCNESINCDFFAPDGTPCDFGGNTLIAGIQFPSGCLLPTGAVYHASQGSNCFQGDRAIVLTFRGAQRCASGLGVLP
jgi:hypothetical protein